MIKAMHLCLILGFTFHLSAHAQMSCGHLFRPQQYLKISGALVTEAPGIEFKGAVTFSSSSLESALDINIKSMINPLGALGYAGPLGPLGPINKWGPVGDSAHNSTSMISSYEWHSLSNYMQQVGGPLSKLGVYGSFSATSTAGQNLNKLMFGSKYLEAGSPLMILGTEGVLGSYGVLGALGPNGAHGFKRDPNTCVYLCTKDDKTVETKFEILVETEKETKAEDLVELYNQKSAAKLAESKQELKGRLAIDGKTAVNETTEFNYQAKAGEFINFLVSPSGFGDSFSIQIVDRSGTVLASSKSKHLINFIVFQFQNDAAVTIRIKNEGRSPYYNPAAEAVQSYTSAMSAFNPFLRGLSTLPKSPLIQSNEWRLHVITSPVKIETSLFPGSHWTQFN